MFEGGNNMSGVKISKRLEKVALCVKEGNRVADIGCDHAYTAIYLIQNNIASHVVAMDINKGPLEKAKKNIVDYRCSDKIETRLSDGAKKLEVGEVDTILISGMGGRLTNKILSDSADVVSRCTQLVLQPQSEIYLVRQYLEQIGFEIIYEDMLIDEGKYYVVMNAYSKLGQNKIKKSENVKLDDNINVLSENIDINQKILDEELKNNEIKPTVCDQYGRYLLESKNEVLKSFLLKESKKTNDIINDLSTKTADERICIRIEELKEKQELISEALKYYEV
jgi:tRNA (adenine22-N1)-methyltransferase